MRPAGRNAGVRVYRAGPCGGLGPAGAAVGAKAGVALVGADDDLQQARHLLYYYQRYYLVFRYIDRTGCFGTSWPVTAGAEACAACPGGSESSCQRRARQMQCARRKTCAGCGAGRLAKRHGAGQPLRSSRQEGSSVGRRPPGSRHSWSNHEPQDQARGLRAQA